MNKLSIYTLKAIRKLYTKCFGSHQLPPLQREEDPDKASEMIYNLLVDDKPCMIARFGSTELAAICNFLSIKKGNQPIIEYIQGKHMDWWWNSNVMAQMQRWSGFFPPTEEKLEQFCQLMIEDTKEVDLLGSWLPSESYLKKELRDIPLVWLDFLIPFLSSNPWSRALKNKKVLIIHPFAKSIQIQYAKRKLLFNDSNVLPDFELVTLMAVQSLGGDNKRFNDWFDALKYMESEMQKIDFDICLIGCGAYGFPLAASVKRMGKKAVHLGGALQLLFGIRGTRWENPDLNQNYNIAGFMNEYWTRPNKQEKPQNANQVEGGCYW